MLARVATELLSIEWFAHAMSELLDGEPGVAMMLDEAMALPGAVTELPAEWNNVVDYWERQQMSRSQSPRELKRASDEQRI